MGQEIESTHFSEEDFAAFDERVAQETEILRGWFEDRVFSPAGGVGGFELEAWLVDGDGNPSPTNEDFIESAESSLVVAELAKFNVELNATPHRLEGDVLTRMHADLAATWKRCRALGVKQGVRLASIGILPSVRPSDLTLDNMSPMKRYRALNEQIFRLRGGEPIRLRIDGPQPIDLLHDDVMLEAAATSFQIHLKVSVDESVALYNASKILSAPMVAVAANSPFLFSHSLWDETRIPLFEQAVSVGGSEFDRRVGFGRGYVGRSLLQCFEVNRDHFPALLPQLSDEPEDQLPHLRFHNGTIWRWNRPLIGFDNKGVPHLRIEHRVIPAGPTVTDMIANAALYFGAVKSIGAEVGMDAESRLPFLMVRDDFYRAAREGLDAKVRWIDGQTGRVRDLVLERILPRAKEGLLDYGLDRGEVSHWLGIIEARVESGRNGAWWQRSWVQRQGVDPGALIQAYLARQDSDEPIHTWSIS